MGASETLGEDPNGRVSGSGPCPSQERPFLARSSSERLCCWRFRDVAEEAAGAEVVRLGPRSGFSSSGSSGPCSGVPT